MSARPCHVDGAKGRREWRHGPPVCGAALHKRYINLVYNASQPPSASSLSYTAPEIYARICTRGLHVQTSATLEIQLYIIQVISYYSQVIQLETMVYTKRSLYH